MHARHVGRGRRASESATAIGGPMVGWRSGVPPIDLRHVDERRPLFSFCRELRYNNNTRGCGAMVVVVRLVLLRWRGGGVVVVPTRRSMR